MNKRPHTARRRPAGPAPQTPAIQVAEQLLRRGFPPEQILTELALFATERGCVSDPAVQELRTRLLAAVDARRLIAADAPEPAVVAALITAIGPEGARRWTMDVPPGPRQRRLLALIEQGEGA